MFIALVSAKRPVDAVFVCVCMVNIISERAPDARRATTRIYAPAIGGAGHVYCVFQCATRLVCPPNMFIN